MPLLTFLSDFGLKEQYVAIVKASILSALPQQNIIDISHQVQLGNIAQAAYLLKSVYRETPEGSVHLVAVGTAYKHSHLLVIYKGHYFIGPDNGLFSLCFNETEMTCYQIGFNTTDSFPAKNIYSEVAVNVLKGKVDMLSKISDFEKKIARKPVFQQTYIRGHVIYVEQSGNLITNISKDYFLNKTAGKKYTVSFEYEKLNKLSTSYHDVDFGECVVFFNSNNLLEIAINHGNASQLLGMKYDDTVDILLND